MTNQEIKNLTVESLRDWFKKEKWVRISSSGKIAGPCGTSKNKKNPDRCLPKAKAQSLSKGERAATAAKKKKAGKKGKTVVKNTKKAKVTREHISERLHILSPEKQKANDAKFDKRMAALKALEKGKELYKAGKITDEELHNLKLKAGTISADSKFISKKVTKEDIRNLVVGLLHESEDTNFKVLVKGPYYLYLPSNDLFTDLDQLGHHGLQRSPDNLTVYKTANELLDAFEDMYYEDPERAIAWAKQNDDIVKFLGTNETLTEKDDRCTRLAKQKYDTWPSAYASGAVVRCRRGEIWKKK